ncbi:hypothetical protein [Massilia sp. TSP1-1-2]|uniref:hypothetical protein n=1 Tax=Massilia sp. TSP1-1-2 TaxID=2804649 RepID=UPI003CF9B0D5
MVSLDKHLAPPAIPQPEETAPQRSPWPFVVMAMLVFCCLMCVLFLDIRIASLLCMAGCAVVRYLGASAEDDGDM